MYLAAKFRARKDASYRAFGSPQKGGRIRSRIVAASFAFHAAFRAQSGHANAAARTSAAATAADSPRVSSRYNL